MVENDGLVWCISFMGTKMVIIILKNKKEGTWEELISEFEQEYGIQLQR